MRLSFIALLFLSASFGGCGDDGVDPRDAATDGAVDGGSGTTTLLPEAAAPPDPGDCPPGWRSVDPTGRAEYCEPYPESGVEDCGVDEAHFPGEPGCARVGTPCPADGFPSELPADRPVRYARIGESGDGTRATPHGTIAEALRAAPDVVVAVGAGVWDEVVTLSSLATLRGACVAETVLGATLEHATQGVVNANADGGALQNLRVGDSPRSGVVAVGAGHRLVLEDVVVSGARSTGIAAVFGGAVEGTNVVVRDTALTPAGVFGRGILAQSGRVDLTRAALERNREAAVFVFDSGRVDLRDAVVRDTGGPVASLDAGLGVVCAGPSSHVELERVAFEHNRSAGWHVEMGASLGATSTLVRGTASSPIDRTLGRALEVTVGSAAVRKTAFLDNQETALSAFFEGSEVTVEDLVILGTRARESDGHFGVGVHLESGGVLRGTRVAIEQNRTVGILVRSAPSLAELQDVAIANTMSQPSDGRFGRGIEVQIGGALSLRRALLEGNREVGVGVEDGSAELRDVTIRDTASAESDGRLGRALGIQGDASMSGERLLLERNRDVAVSVIGGTAQLTHLTVTDTESSDDLMNFGRAASVQGGGTLTITDARLERNRDVGVYVGGAGTNAVMERVQVLGVRERACAESACVGAGFGTGIGVFDGAAATVTQFVVENAALCGVHVSRGGEIDLRNGEVRSCTIGACVQQDGYDLDRLTDGVRYLDNGVALESTSLPIPEATDPYDAP